MTRLCVATPSQRFFAALINGVIGALPAIIPSMMQGDSSLSATWTPGKLNLLAGFLALIQIGFVHRMQGSPGVVFLGLTVRNLDGSKLTFATTVVRAIPYLMALALMMVKRGIYGTSYAAPVAVGVALVYLFLCLSAFTVFVSGRGSLLDLLTKTMVAKI
jgi:uncharacterized RDD family membrane protein YckC